MKTSKWLRVLCALAMVATGLAIRAADNPAQAAARIALAKQLFELNAHPATTHAEAQANQASANATARPLDEKQRAAQMAALAAATAAKPCAETLAKADRQIAHATPPAKPVVAAKPQPAPQPAAAAPQPAKPVEADYVGKDLGMKPIVAPALPISAGKEDRLQALLMKYKTDQISPAEYQKQRAAILAEP
jgi:hypothetical protein